jgi:hypothetical protein
MSKPYYKLNPEEFIPWLTNFIEIVNVNQAMLPITAAQIAALTTQRDTIQDKLNARVAAEQAAEAATVALNGAHGETRGEISFFNSTFKANKTIPRELLEELGLNVSGGKTSPPPNVPLDLTVVPNAAGFNELRWNGNGNKRTTVYIIEAQTAGSPNWIQVGAINATRWTHQNQKPGVEIGYRVKATRAGQESPWGSPAVAYFNG